MAKIEQWQLKQRQSLPLEAKIALSQNRIKEWYEHWEGKVYVSFSGGKDSTVLLSLAREIYPDIPAVFCDTGLEYPEIRRFVQGVDGVEWVRPKMPFRDVINKYGYPVVSKEQAQFIYKRRHSRSEKLRNTVWVGNRWGRGKISEKWKFLCEAPFEISDYCCDVMKKSPFHSYERKTGFHPIIGSLADESTKRVQDYLRYGCNAFEVDRPISRPLAFWLESDIWEYLRSRNIPYSPIYDMGYTRTGCMFCMFGVHLEKEPNRFQRMQKTHPKQWKFCMDELGLRQVLDYIHVPCEAKE